jgi:hypothetical protein
MVRSVPIMLATINRAGLMKRSNLIRRCAMKRTDTRRLLGPLINLARRRHDAAILAGLIRLVHRWESKR